MAYGCTGGVSYYSSSTVNQWICTVRVSHVCSTAMDNITNSRSMGWSSVVLNTKCTAARYCLAADTYQVSYTGAGSTEGFGGSPTPSSCNFEVVGVNCVVGNGINDLSLGMIVKSSLHLSCRVVGNRIQNVRSRVVGNRITNIGRGVVTQPPLNISRRVIAKSSL